MAKDYYLILGVPIDARPDAIRSAFRKLALRYHPDRGTRNSGAFRDISEAYGVLSDPRLRERYDRERRASERGLAHGTLRPERPAESLVSEPLPITGLPERVRPSFEALLDRLAANRPDLEPPKAEREEPLVFELILTPDEARRGVRVPFEVPVFRVCGACRGTGRDWLFPCLECDASGSRAEPVPVNVDVPAGVRDGTRIEVSLRRLSIRNLWLAIHVRIARH